MRTSRMTTAQYAAQRCALGGIISAGNAARGWTEVKIVMGTILAIDPGNIQSGYVVVEHDGEEIRRVLEAGKKGNNELLPMLERKLYGNGHDVAIEMIAGMGMTVGQEVFDTCVWIGRFWQTVLWQTGYGPTRIFRREEKLDLCGSLSAKDANIRQSLVDRYAPGQPNFGKGTKKDPGFFYGFSADMWAAMAVAVPGT